MGAPSSCRIFYESQLSVYEVCGCCPSRCSTTSTGESSGLDSWTTQRNPGLCDEASKIKKKICACDELSSYLVAVPFNGVQMCEGVYVGVSEGEGACRPTRRQRRGGGAEVLSQTLACADYGSRVHDQRASAFFRTARGFLWEVVVVSGREACGNGYICVDR